MRFDVSTTSSRFFHGNITSTVYQKFT